VNNWIIVKRTWGWL